MRCAGFVLAVFLTAIPLQAEEKKNPSREIDKQLFDVLKDIHNRGADLFNAGDSAGSYRLFAGSLQTSRAVLVHRPLEQKYIDDALAEAEREPAIARRAFILHESIEKLRIRLRIATPAVKGIEPELIEVPPKEFKQEKKEPITQRELLGPPKKVQPVKDGVIGRIFWRGQPLTGAEIAFVSRGQLDIRVFEAVSDIEGGYQLERVHPGIYIVILSKPGAKKLLLPERYATTTTSPLISEVRGGETLDFMLQ